MASLRVSLITNDKEGTAAYVKGVFPERCDVRLQSEAEMRAEIGEIDVLVPGHIQVPKELIEQGTKLKLIHCGTGYNNVDLEAASAVGAYVCVTPNVAAQSVAELVFSSFAALKTQIITMDRLMKEGGWKSTDFIGVPEFKGKTLGVVGYGNIGRCAATIGRGFGMNIVAHDPNVRDPGDGTAMVGLGELLEGSDYITLHVLLTDQTRGMMSGPQFDAMKDTAYLANASRGPVVDEAALIEALKQRKIAGACLDVFEKEPLAADSALRGLDNVVLTPHIAYCSNEALRSRYAFFAGNCQRLLDGEKPKMAVNESQVAA